MKSPVLPVAAATALLGFGLGWLVKPTGSATPDGTAQADGTKNGANAPGSGGPGDRNRPPLVLTKRGDKRDDAQKDDDATRPASVQSAWREAAKNAERTRIARYSEALGLSDDQQKQIGSIRKEERANFESLLHTGRTPAELLQEAASAEAKADEQIRKTLDPEQIAAMDEYKSRQKTNEIESNAQSVLTDISATADLSSEQRESILALLRENSTKEYESRPAGWELMSENFSIFGGSKSAMIDNLGLAFAGSEVANDPAAMQQRIQDAQRKTAENRVNQLGGILTPAQLSQYRSTLQSRLSLSQSVPKLPTQH